MEWTRTLAAAACCAGCTAHVHLEAGIRHDGGGRAFHAAALLAIGADHGDTPRTYRAFTVGAGADLDQHAGASGTFGAAYVGGGPGPLVHGARFVGLGRGVAKLGGSISYVIGQHQRETFCLICKADREVDYTTSFGAIGLQLSTTIGDDGPGIAGDVVLDLLY